MDPLDFLGSEELLRFFHCHKTEMSCMENPQTFISQLRDHNLMQEDKYKKMSRMKSKDNKRKALYDVLDWLERERSQHIKDFWRCVFKEVILNNYPTLRLLRNRLMDGSYNSDIQLPERVEKEKTDEGKRMEPSDGEEEEEGEKKVKSAKKKRKKTSKNTPDEEGGQARPSTSLTPGQKKKSQKISFYSPLKKGEKSDIWTWGIYKGQLPVTCGKQKGTLNRGRLAKGEKCVFANKQWFTPTEFERFAGKRSFKNWKLSIRCMDTPLGKLVQEGHLKSVRYKGGYKKAKKSLFPSNVLVTDEEGEMEEQEHAGAGGKKVFKVTCGAITGTLHEKRFSSGTRGKSIRTEISWMTPVEFMREASCHTNASWRKNIMWEGEPLSVLIEAKALRMDSLLCDCPLCKPDSKDLCVVILRVKRVAQDSRPWMCTFCVFGSNQGCYYQDDLKREAVMSSQISQDMLRCQYLLLYLWGADKEQIFATNPNLYLKDYSTVIQSPMWLGSVADKLQNQLYETVGEFVSDIQLIFTNCASYNRENAEILTMGNKLKEIFDREFKNVFNICEYTVDQ
ncbi:nuclear body protein SP140-like protein [Chaetodon trifascialis]|uniref:nuclear body protein SP140-like protein n=1 Tax=Chaetodon trifascialis TaxID=109706 RepID=UPI00399489E7